MYTALLKAGGCWWTIKPCWKCHKRSPHVLWFRMIALLEASFSHFAAVLKSHSACIWFKFAMTVMKHVRTCEVLTSLMSMGFENYGRGKDLVSDWWAIFFWWIIQFSLCFWLKLPFKMCHVCNIFFLKCMSAWCVYNWWQSKCKAYRE